MALKLFILSSIFFFFSCNLSSQDSNEVVTEDLWELKLPFENIKLTPTVKILKLEGKLDSLICIQGNSSLKLSKEANHPLKLSLKNFNKNKFYKLSYWSKEKTVLKVIAFFKKERTTLWAERVVDKKGKWTKKELIIHFPMVQKDYQTEIIISKPKGKNAWIDDLKINEISKLQTTAFVQLQIPDEEFITLKKYREKAAHKSIITSENKKWVKGLFDGKETKFKLKGDWTDHITEGLWSLKLSSKKKLKYGLKSFNIQTPIVRNFHKEWLFFELCKDQGLTTPSFNFDFVSFYGSDPFYCAFEENFSNQFIKRKLGYKSPVLRFYEDHIFPYFVYSWSHPESKSLHFETSYIYPYDKAFYKGKGEEVFNTSAKKLRALINGNIKLADYDKWATLLAICSLTKSYHALAWHNQRFFLNKKGKIEPIPYDGNTPKGEAESWSRGKSILGDFREYNDYPNNPMYEFQLHLLKDTVFRVLYAEKLLKVSNLNYLKNFLEKRKDKLNEIYVNASHFYSFDKSTTYLTNNAEKINNALYEFKALPNVLYDNFFSKKPERFNGSNIPLQPEGLQNFIIAIKDSNMVKVINGTGTDVIVKILNEKQELKNNSFIELQGSKLKGEITIIQKDNPKIKFDLEIINWMSILK